MISDWQSVFTLTIFLLTNLVGVFPIHFSVPLPKSVESLIARIAVYLRICVPTESCCDLHPELYKTRGTRQCSRRNDNLREGPLFRWHKTAFDFQTTPPIAVLILLATKSLQGSDVRKGIVGTNGVEPINIMALFISLAYMAISLDTTGLFRFLAFWVVSKGGSSGRLLYFYLYLFFFISGIFVGNDPVILFGTPFLAYFSHVSGIIPSTAWIFAQFTTANMSSAVLPSSNLTNLVLTEAFSFSFISYSAHTIVPTIATAAAVYPILSFLLFRSKKFIPTEVNVVTLQRTTSEQETQTIGDGSMDPRGLSGLNDKHGAIFGSILLGITLAVLVGTSPLGVPVWMITVPPALIMLARDIWHDRTKWKQQKTSTSDSRTSNSDPEAMQLHTFPESDPQNVTDNEVAKKEKNSTILSYYRDLKENTLPTVLSIIPRLPLSLVLFAFCMFILVQALTTWGWVEVFASWWASWIDVCGKKGITSAIIGAIWGMLIVSTFLCNLCGTNIGTTILLARVLQSWLEKSASSNIVVDPRVRLGAIYALALGTNFGAFSFSFSASLAGLLWRDILRQKGIIVRQKQFALNNLPLIGTAIVISGATLIAEVYIISK